MEGAAAPPGVPATAARPCTSPKAAGLVQARGQQITELNPGDVVFAPDGEEHWHGAMPGHFMTHLSITEGAPHWGPHVTDAEYQSQRNPGE